MLGDLIIATSVLSIVLLSIFNWILSKKKSL
jgi:hypothetical protein